MTKFITTNPRLIQAMGVVNAKRRAMIEPHGLRFSKESSSLSISHDLLEVKWDLEKHVACSQLEGDFSDEYRSQLVARINELEVKLAVRLVEASAAIVQEQASNFEARKAMAALIVIEKEEGVEHDSYSID